MSVKCANCWWYCHSDSKCYRGVVIGARPEGSCKEWHFDGLADWERDDALMTKENK